jgi:adenylate kinase family enzyme
MTPIYSFPVDAVLLLGPTGSGKSPLGDHIARNGLFGRNAHHLDFGAELRAIISQNETSSLYTASEIAFIRGVLEGGLLLEDRHFPLARKIFVLFLCRSGFSSDDVLILNGIPRHAGQANDIASVAAIRTLVLLECSIASVFCRLRDNPGGDRTGRFDDDVELVNTKLRLFNERTAPLVDHYRIAGTTTIVPVMISDATTSEEAYRQISMPAAGHPPIPFVAEPPQR